MNVLHLRNKDRHKDNGYDISHIAIHIPSSHARRSVFWRVDIQVRGQINCLTCPPPASHFKVPLSAWIYNYNVMLCALPWMLLVIVDMLQIEHAQ